MANRKKSSCCLVFVDLCSKNIHCIGDRANRAVLDILEDVINGSNDTDPVDVAQWRPRIEHAQIMTMDDLTRVGKLGGACA